MPQRPTLSVAMCNYNYGHTIKHALEAILTQSFQPTEVIVIDDASTDNSVEIVKEMMTKYPNLVLLRNERNMGVLYTGQIGLKRVSGDYLYYGASDDYILPGFLEKSMGMLIKYPEAGLSFADTGIYDIETDQRRDVRFYLSDKPEYFDPDRLAKVIKRELYTPIHGPTVIVKRKALEEAGNYIPDLRWSCDAFAHHVIGFRHGACYIPEVLTVQRLHSKQLSAGIRVGKQEREVIRKVYDMLLMPKYKDVLTKFISASPISSSAWEALREALLNRKYRRFISPKLIKFALYDKFIRRPLLYIIPKQAARNIMNTIRRVTTSFRRSNASNRD